MTKREASIAYEIGIASQQPIRIRYTVIIVALNVIVRNSGCEIVWVEAEVGP